MAQFLWIPWRLPRLNELLDERGKVFRKASGAARASQVAKKVSHIANGYSVLKKKWSSVLAGHARTRGFEVLPGCWDFTYLFVETNARFDPSNICSGAAKLIEDALVDADLMTGDGWGTVHSITNHFVRRDPTIPSDGVLVAVSNRPLTRAEMLDQVGVMAHAERFHRRENTRAESAKREHRAPGDSPLDGAPAGAPPAPSARVRPVNSAVLQPSGLGRANWKGNAR